MARFSNMLSMSAGTYWFATRFEEVRTLGYLRNIIGSRLAEQRTAHVVNMVISVFGKAVVAETVRKVLPAVAAKEEFMQWLANSDENRFMTRCQGLCLLRQGFLQPIAQRMAKAARRRGDQAERRIDILRKTLNLSAAEADMVGFFYLVKGSSIMNDAFNGNYESIIDMTEVMKLRAYGDAVLGLPRAEFMRTFSEGVVIPAGILERRGSTLELVQWCVDYLSGIGKDELANEFFTIGNDEELDAGDFGVAADDMLVLDGFMKGRTGRNFLLYGTPGTGKTSFARALAKRFGKQVLSVKIPERDSIRDRLLAVYAAANTAGAGDSVILVDEADEILNTAFRPMGASEVSKSWVNNFLDHHGKKVVWISNRSADIDSSTMRRFAFSLEFRPFDAAKRLTVLKRVLAKSGIAEGYFTEAELKDLCQSYAVNASGLVHAVQSVAKNTRAKKATVLRKIRAILRNHEKAIGGKGAAREQKTFDHYSLEGLNASADLGNIVDAVKRTASLPEGEAPSVSMLLYGLPGTGKTEFVNYLGHTLGKEVLLKRASDIQDKYVGESEKRIAASFREARERGLVLFFDEADSFLFPRANATHSWEKSYTNEILTQLENHRGVAIFATNDIEGLDHAALRRFAMKVRFDPLKPAGIVKLYEKLLAPFVPDAALTADERKWLSVIPNLTPGDFAAIRNQYAVLGNKGLTHEKLIRSLEDEVKYKKTGGKVMGF